jgi:aminobenzoyl-glutamate transport protein
VRSTGIGTVTALMIPYSICFLLAWIGFLLLFWGLGIPLGIQGTYTYP